MGTETIDATEWTSWTYMRVWTAVASEDLTIKYKDHQGSVYIDQASIMVIELDALTENTDWFYDEVTANQALTTTWVTGANAPSITWTPNGTDDWWVMGTARIVI